METFMGDKDPFSEKRRTNPIETRAAASPPPEEERRPAKRCLKKSLLLGGGVMVATALISCTTFQLAREQPATVPGAEYVGMEDCTLCHEEVMANYKATAHGHLRGDVKGESCEACHGPGSKHVEAGEGSIVMPNAANCLECHSGNHHLKNTDQKVLMDWNFAGHRMAGLNCTDCHNPHLTTYKALRIKPEFQVQNIDAKSALCLSCHQEVLGRLSMPYHHPIREGAMSCTDCHNPHSSQSRQLLAKNETCAKCHQAQQGPFSREHPPVAEDCTICHEPHGSPVSRMARVGEPMLCLQCHSLTQNRHNNVAGQISPAALRDCTACHGSIHGSDMDGYFRH